MRPSCLGVTGAVVAVHVCLVHLRVAHERCKGDGMQHSSARHHYAMFYSSTVSVVLRRVQDHHTEERQGGGRGARRVVFDGAGDAWQRRRQQEDGPVDANRAVLQNGREGVSLKLRPTAVVVTRFYRRSCNGSYFHPMYIAYYTTPPKYFVFPFSFGWGMSSFPSETIFCMHFLRVYIFS